MDKDKIWIETKRLLGDKINNQVIDTWFNPLNIKDINGSVVVISSPNKFLSDWINDHYHNIICEALSSVMGIDGVKLEFKNEDSNKIPEKRRSEEERSEGITERPVISLNQGIDKKRGTLNPKYTFETFVVGSSNQFAQAACLAVAESPGKSYNPLFLYGGVGLGKTHLLNAIGHFILKKKAGVKITYVSAEQFTNEVISSIRYEKMPEFRQRHRSTDILLIDDIQFIAGKERTQEEFFHTFNTLYEAQKQIVVSSDRFPKEMPGIEERLRSRFECGLIADIQPADLETKIAILEKKAEVDRMALPPDVAMFLATNIKTNIRELEGSLIRLGAFSSLTNEPINIEMARRVLRDTIDEKKKVISMEEIQQTVSNKYHIRISDIKSKKRSKNLVFPRQISMYIGRKLTGLSFPEIGKHFGGKDHSTVIHACKQIEKMMGIDKDLHRTIEALIKEIKEQ
ncbi:MAG: chromosomal replication initiator protein DnaA [Nitrospirota bacterium]